jgi:hypothetical protein
MSLLGVTALKSFFKSLYFMVPPQSSLQYHLETSLSIHIEIFSGGVFPWNMRK